MFFFNSNKFDQLISHSYSSDINQLKKTSRIIIIDDDPNACPNLDRLKQEGYDLTYWSKVDQIQYLESGKFDIIILDIEGVATDLGKDDGLDVLRSIKKNNPAQYVIAFSGQETIHQKKDFWKLADDQIKKPITMMDFKFRLDEAIKTAKSPLRTWEYINRVLEDNNYDPKSISKLKKHLFKIITQNGTTEESARKKLKKIFLKNSDINMELLQLLLKCSLKLVLLFI